MQYIQEQILYCGKWFWQKTFIKELINLIQNTNTNYYPFKVIGKTLGMNKNEARNYAIKILNIVNPKVFNNQYEN